MLHNSGSAAADVELLDEPPLPYRVGSASGGIWWDDIAGAIRWQGRLESGESRVFTFSTYGPVPPVPHNTVYTNRVTIDDGVHPALVRSVSVLANPEATATPSVTATAEAPVWNVWLPLVSRWHAGRSR